MLSIKIRKENDQSLKLMLESMFVDLVERASCSLDELDILFMLKL